MAAIEHDGRASAAADVVDRPGVHGQMHVFVETDVLGLACSSLPGGSLAVFQYFFATMLLDRVVLIR